MTTRKLTAAELMLAQSQANRSAAAIRKSLREEIDTWDEKRLGQYTLYLRNGGVLAASSCTEVALGVVDRDVLVNFFAVALFQAFEIGAKANAEGDYPVTVKDGVKAASAPKRDSNDLACPCEDCAEKRRAAH